jgi:predicted nuclease of predicted toxin-antitoxin system
VRLFIDECLSPVLARRLNETGLHDAVHPRDLGRLGEPDHAVLQRCIRDSRTIVTVNARDFRRLIGAAELHPGLIILPAVDREGSWALLGAALAAVLAEGEPAQVMINRVAEIAASGEVLLYDLPTG